MKRQLTKFCRTSNEERPCWWWTVGTDTRVTGTGGNYELSYGGGRGNLHQHCAAPPQQPGPAIRAFLSHSAQHKKG